MGDRRRGAADENRRKPDSKTSHEWPAE